MVFTHRPVFLTEAIEVLDIKPDGIYIDGTFGRGGHSQAILERLNLSGRLIAFDKDPEAIHTAQQKFGLDNRFEIIHASFTQIHAEIKRRDLLGKINGILLDLGISSPQIDDPTRGFSFSHSGPLDMRMDTTQGESVADFLTHVEEKTLADILFEYGEEKEARRIARTLVKKRSETPITTTQQLADLISSVMPSREKLGKHPATRTFQALRIYINRELEDLTVCLPTLECVVVNEGRLVVISFHSLEDRIVKQFMQKGVQGKEPLRGLPLKESEISREQKWRWCIKMQKPSELEIQENPRARSAILRAVIKKDA